jgi:hypothetical protein
VFREIKKWGNETLKAAMYMLSAVLQLVTMYAMEIFVAVMTEDVLVCIHSEKIIHVYKDLFLTLLK